MEWLEVLQRIEAGESHHTEFKRGLGDLAPVGRAICAFANSEGGVIVLGVADRGEIVGVREDTERVQERLTAFLQTGCSAPVTARVGRREDPNGRVHWVEVPRQRGFEPMRYDGRVWIRRQRSSVAPSPTELQELYNIFGYILTEERAIQDATAAHIDDAAFRAYLYRLGFDTEQGPQPATEDDLRTAAYSPMSVVRCGRRSTAHWRSAGSRSAIRRQEISALCVRPMRETIEGRMCCRLLTPPAD